MNCPKCKVELEKRSIDTVGIDECPKCSGIWFDEDELRQAKDDVESLSNWQDFEIWKHEDRFKVLANPLTCPSCESAMVVLEYGGTSVEIDFCGECKGIWLDDAEFESILDALKTEAATMPMSEYVRCALEEAKEVLVGPERLWSEWKDLTAILRIFQYRIFVDNPKLLDKVISFYRSSPLK